MRGQTTEKGNVAFQYFVNDGAVPGNMVVRLDGLGGPGATGRPFSATEERHTVQVLGDGTRIDKKESDKYYRDDQGRTRVERDGGATVIISDPVAGSTTEMSTANKTAHKTAVWKQASSFTTAVAPPEPGPALDKLRLAVDKLRTERDVAQTQVFTTGAAGIAYARRATITTSKDAAEAQHATTEDLGTQIVNGVPAQGTRSTIVIPVGQIGNDREIKVVSERWFSTDLQMLIKSSNNDPRFGETTYELTNIVQGAQDSGLFQVPPDFSVNGLR
jgi:hypothetical protein